MAKAGTDGQSYNRLLTALTPGDRDALAPYLEAVQLNEAEVLAEPAQQLEYAYFPHGAVICLIATMAQRGGVETATIGSEGFLGFEALLDGETAGSRAVVTIPGPASRIALKHLKSATVVSARVQRLLLRYVRAFIVQTLQSVACNNLHPVDRRCARWLLTVQDTARRDTFSLTQKSLADLLGVHRPSITVVARALQASGVIRYRRGTLTIADRAGLEQAACECYAETRRALDEIFLGSTDGA